jgi:spermidine synthase
MSNTDAGLFSGSVHSVTDLWFTEKFRNGAGMTLRIEEILFAGRSDFQKVEMFRTAEFGNMLVLDDAVMTTERDEFVYHEMLTAIPFFAHPNPKTALIVGGSDGGTARELCRYPQIEYVRMVEIDRVVVEQCKAHLPSIASAMIAADEGREKRLTVEINDAAAYMAGTGDAKDGRTYDIILNDSTDPVGPGEKLFNVPYFKNVAARLNADGVFGMQTESPFFHAPAIPEIYARLREVFPLVEMYTAHIPTYPSGLWSFAFCSKSGTGAQKHFDPARVEAAQKAGVAFKYYNAGIHRAAFALPSYVAALTKG